MLYQDKGIEELKAIIEAYQNYFFETFKRKPTTEELTKPIMDLIAEKTHQDFQSRFKTLTITNLMQAISLVKDDAIAKDKKADDDNHSQLDKQTIKTTVGNNESKAKKQKRNS